MPLPPEPRGEHPSTYFVEDRSNQEELNRIQIQDRLYTAGMGGVLPEQPDPTRFLRVLDVGCGTGNWLIELAQTIPTCARLVGVDASATFVEYARAQAMDAQVSDRVEFHVADALRMLEFPDASFDLVNHRLASSWLRTWDWRKLLQEYRRVCSPGGVVRVTEYEGMAVSNSPAHSRFSALSATALFQAGHFFTPTNQGMTDELAHLFEQHGLQQVQTRVCTLEYHAGTPEGERFVENNKLFSRTILPFLRKWTRIPDNYEEFYQQMLHEMQQPDFVATWDLLTVWGTP
ncbi:MAG TPA: class I SAM-dependent methyltransferase [Ktedonobacteraceae bacterium]|jgi:ubiquinone/menaquinone biosynthesis C-methylase UbiE|nr:class I SAM-dependent methyltransferase [Ktedonobacteraceae bacterium]